MIFFWEFSKLLESIIFRNFFICVEKLNYIKNYMKTRRETRKGGRPSPHFVLRNRTEHLYYSRHKEPQVLKIYQNIFKTRSRPSQLKTFLRKKNTLFSSFGFFFYLLCVYWGIPFSAMLLSFLVCWKNLDQFLLKQSFVNHPTMTVKMWKYLLQNPRKHSQVLWKWIWRCLIFLCDL